MKLLVLAPHAVDPAAIRDAAPAGEDLSGAEVMVVVPAVQQSAIRFWMTDNDDEIAAARQAATETADALHDEGVRARAVAGESEPMLALRDALATFPADRVLIIRGDGSAYGSEDLGQARELGVPVWEA